MFVDSYTDMGLWVGNALNMMGRYEEVISKYGKYKNPLGNALFNSGRIDEVSIRCPYSEDLRASVMIWEGGQGGAEDDAESPWSLRQIPPLSWPGEGGFGGLCGPEVTLRHRPDAARGSGGVVENYAQSRDATLEGRDSPGAKDFIGDRRAEALRTIDDLNGFCDTHVASRQWFDYFTLPSFLRYIDGSGGHRDEFSKREEFLRKSNGQVEYYQ